MVARFEVRSVSYASIKSAALFFGITLTDAKISDLLKITAELDPRKRKTLSEYLAQVRKDFFDAIDQAEGVNIVNKWAAKCAYDIYPRLLLCDYAFHHQSR